MTIIQFRSKISFPDMTLLAQSIKDINRAVNETEDGAYTYFADNIKMASTISGKLTNQVTAALTTLPGSLQNLNSVQAFAENIAKINDAEKAGKISENAAEQGRKQLQDRLNEGLSSVITSFENNSDALAESRERLSNYSAKIDVRIKDALSTEEANQKRAKADSDRENNRLATLEARLVKLDDAVDKNRGGPTEDFASILPDEKELSSLLDIGATDAAAPEVAAAKKAVEAAVAEIKKVLKVVDKTIKFIQLSEMRDEMFTATQEQRKIVNATTKTLDAINTTLRVLDTTNSAGKSMETAAEEVNKMVETFSGFVEDLKNLDGKQITETTMSSLFDTMNKYLEQVRTAQNKVILT